MTATIHPFRARDSYVLEAAVVDGKPPPMDMEVEGSILASIMTEARGGEAVLLVKDLLKPEHFYSEAHRHIYVAAIEIHEAGGEPTALAIEAYLKSVKRLQQIPGGVLYLNELLVHNAAYTNVRQNAEIMFDLWRKRQMILLCQKAVGELYLSVGTTGTQGYLEGLAKAMGGISCLSPKASGQSLGDVLKQKAHGMAAAVRDAGKPRLPGLTTTFRDLDRMSGGIRPGEKITVLGLPGRGKSVFGAQIAMANAERGIGVALFATEQSPAQLTDRMLAAITGINSHRIRAASEGRDSLSADEWRRHTVAMARASKWPLVFDHTQGLTYENVLTRARTLKETMPRAHGVPLGMVVVDHLHRLETPRSLTGQAQDKYTACSDATRAFKRLATDLGIVVVELAQQKDEKDANKNPKKPARGMACWSSLVEQEADMVIYLWERGPNDHVVVVTKLRDGQDGEFEVIFDKPTSRMLDVDGGDGPSPFR